MVRKKVTTPYMMINGQQYFVFTHEKKLLNVKESFIHTFRRHKIKWLFVVHSSYILINDMKPSNFVYIFFLYGVLGDVKPCQIRIVKKFEKLFRLLYLCNFFVKLNMFELRLIFMQTICLYQRQFGIQFDILFIQFFSLTYISYNVNVLTYF